MDAWLPGLIPERKRALLAEVDGVEKNLIETLYSLQIEELVGNICLLTCNAASKYQVMTSLPLGMRVFHRFGLSSISTRARGRWSSSAAAS